MELDEFLIKLNDLRLELAANRTREVILVAHESLALIRRRVQNSGMDADGDTFGFYSAQYEKVRDSRNLQTDFIDLTATGGMWRELEVVLEEEEDEISVAVVQGRTQRSVDLLEFNSERYGDLLRLSDEEDQLVTNAYAERRLKFINNFLT